MNIGSLIDPSLGVPDARVIRAERTAAAGNIVTLAPADRHALCSAEAA